MKELLAEMGVDTVGVSRSLEASVGFAGAYLRATDGAPSIDAHMSAATAYRQAAAHAVALGRDDALELFQQATQAYATAGHPYAATLGNLGYEPTSNFAHQERGRIPEDVFLLWNHLYLRRRLWTQGGARLIEDLDGFRNLRVGVLGTSVGTLLELWRLLVRSEGRPDVDELVRHLAPLTITYSAAVDRARSDRYHWRLLSTPFHPAEPDLMAILVGVGAVLAPDGLSLQAVLGACPMGAEGRSLLATALTSWEEDARWQRGRFE